MEDIIEKSQQSTDAEPDNWVDKYAPLSFRPYLRMARFDRAIGSWLLFWPCAWSLSLAAGRDMFVDYPKFLLYIALLFLGSIIMRGAGCVFNDIVDHNLDGKVERTKLRPIPSGQLTLNDAYVFLATLLLAGLLILLQFNLFTIILGISSLFLVTIYPFTKRFTYWPQLILGLTFNWGALVGWAAWTGELSLTPMILYIGSIAWTIGYDTIYAMQDREDDLIIGIKSTALKYGDKLNSFVTFFYSIALLAFIIIGFFIESKPIYFIVILAVFGHFAWQIKQCDYVIKNGIKKDAGKFLHLFRSNKVLGWLMLCTIISNNFYLYYFFS